VINPRRRASKRPRQVAGQRTNTYISPIRPQPLRPVSDELTPYGAKKFRTPTAYREYNGLRGKPMEAVVLDIDDTLQDWGASVSKRVLKWAEDHYRQGRVLLVFTAREHEWQFRQSFDWLVAHLPFPFIGPFCRGKTDPRYASEQKRELAQGFEDMGLYRIMGAADDNPIVNDMWKQWAIDHFDDPTEFDLLECARASYPDWRANLGSTKSQYETKHRPAGTSHYGYGNTWGSSPITSWGTDPVDKRYKRLDEFIEQPHPGDNIAEDARWHYYFAQRAKAGAYMGVDRSVDLEDVLDEDYGFNRAELEDIASARDRSLTPDDLADMSDEELREAAGVTFEEYVKVLYEGVDQKFGGRYSKAELDKMDTDEIEHLLTLDQDDADTYMAIFNPADPGERWSFDPVQNARIQYRMDLEDDVKASYPDMDVQVIYAKDVKDLEALRDAAVSGDRWAEVVAEIVEVELPPVGAEGVA